MESPFKNKILSDKVVLVTGGGSGVCFGIAKVLGEHGAKVVLMGRRQEVLDAAVSELAQAGVDAFSVAGDVRREADAKKAIKEAIGAFGKLNVLVNGAAANFLCCPEDLSVSGFKTIVDIDLTGTFTMCRHVFEVFKDGGLIINISATLHYAGTPFQLSASAAKAGLDALTVNLATEWGPYGIRVCGIAPGPIGDTEGMSRLVPEVVRQTMLRTVPVGRFGHMQEIGLAAVYLSSSAGAFINGTTLVIDGGQWASKPPVIPRRLVKELSQARIRSVKN